MTGHASSRRSFIRDTLPGYLSWNNLITLTTVSIAALVLVPFARWALFDAVWTGTAEDCRAPGAGACWAFVGEKMRFMIFGFYPSAEQWRPLLVMVLFAVATVTSCFRPFWRHETVIAWLLILAVMFAVMIGGEWPYRLALLVGFCAIAFFSPLRGTARIAVSGAAALAAFHLNGSPSLPMAGALVAAGAALMLAGRPGNVGSSRLLAAAFLLAGGALVAMASAGLSYQRTETWSGLPLTIWLATIGMGGAFPLAVLLALGRRSQILLVRVLCTGIIEIVRGVPLITLLFMAAFLLPILLDGETFNKLIRIQLILILFIACYLAEIIRGGLQAIPPGQYEAASALGLRFWPQMLTVVFPQVFRITIPSIINLTINIFKDTSLVLIVGLFDFLQAVRSSMTDAAWLGISTEGYVFAALTYFVFCFCASRLSIGIERKLGERYSH